MVKCMWLLGLLVQKVFPLVGKYNCNLFKVNENVVTEYNILQK